jgi:hypothetical protein
MVSGMVTLSLGVRLPVYRSRREVPEMETIQRDFVDRFDAERARLLHSA